MVLPTIIQLSNISKQYLSLSGKIKILALENISFTISKGSITLLMGKNGSGKSTLLRIIAGLLRPTSGSIEIFKNVPSNRSVQRNIGYLPEAPQFHKGVSGHRFTSYMAKLKRIPHPSKNAKEWLEKFGIVDQWLNVSTELYSEGMKERLGLAITFMSRPQIILLDEPLANLDKSGKQFVLELIKDSAHSQHNTIIIATHNEMEFQQLANQKFKLKKGILC